VSAQREVTEYDVELAERYARALKMIEDAEEFTEADVERAERYVAALKNAEAAREELSPTQAYLRSLSDDELLAEYRAERRAVQARSQQEVSEVGELLERFRAAFNWLDSVEQITEADCERLNDLGRYVSALEARVRRVRSVDSD
jgi:uncharacterized coiled-coil DUF342 family protein